MKITRLQANHLSTMRHTMSGGLDTYSNSVNAIAMQNLQTRGLVECWLKTPVGPANGRVVYGWVLHWCLTPAGEFIAELLNCGTLEPSDDDGF